MPDPELVTFFLQQYLPLLLHYKANLAKIFFFEETTVDHYEWEKVFHTSILPLENAILSIKMCRFQPITFEERLYKPFDVIQILIFLDLKLLYYD